jgi:uncharacterized integral membrane protein
MPEVSLGSERIYRTVDALCTVLVHQLQLFVNGARFLPIFSSNDLVAGSWYFVYGSILFTLISIVPLININSSYWPARSFGDFTSAELIVMALLFILSGVLFTVGR